MQIEEILIIKNAHENYGVSTEDINHISRVPSLTPLPLRPSGVRGLCSVGGSVVSMVDMNQLLGIGEVDIEASSSRLLSLNAEHSSNALLVSEVYNTVEICQENIEYLDNKNDPIIAIYRYKDILVQIISLNELFSKINRVKIESKDVKAGKLKQETIKDEDSGRFLIFSMSNEKFALNIDYLQEIILSDIEFTEIAGSSQEVLGLVTLRDEILTIIDLRTYYGFEAKNSDDNRILVVSHNGKKVGLYIDSILDIKNFFTKDIEYMSDHFEDKKISGVIHDENSLISFFDHEVLDKIFEKNDSFIDSNTANNDSIELEEYVMEVIVFKLLGKEYAFEVENVDEIIDMIPSTNVSFSDEIVDGIINIRGQIVTMVSLFKKLDIHTKINDDSKIIVCNINDTKIGFVVDSVSDILNIKKSDIREEDDEFFDKILHLDNGNRLVLSMDIDKIVEVEG
jgi:purine-binding chemotaxis protein CheW